MSSNNRYDGDRTSEELTNSARATLGWEEEGRTDDGKAHRENMAPEDGDNGQQMGRAEADGDGSEAGDDKEVVRTLFLTGFPADVKLRELHNLFRPFPGYEDSLLRSTGVAFAIFVTQREALAARDALNGIHFDPDSPEIFRIELAKTNSKRRRHDYSSSAEFWSKEREAKRLRRAATTATPALPPAPPAHAALGHNNGLNSVSNVQAARATLDAYEALRAAATLGQLSSTNSQMYGLGLPQPFSPLDAYLGIQGNRLQAAASALALPATSAILGNSAPPSAGQRVKFPPCSTLYVSNLSLRTDVSELIEEFSRYPGYVKTQTYQKNQNLNAFIQFRDVDSASAALYAQQGAILRSSDRGPIRIEFAKNQMVIKMDDREAARSMHRGLEAKWVASLQIVRHSTSEVNSHARPHYGYHETP